MTVCKTKRTYQRATGAGEGECAAAQDATDDTNSQGSACRHALKELEGVVAGEADVDGSDVLRDSIDIDTPDTAELIDSACTGTTSK